MTKRLPLHVLVIGASHLPSFQIGIQQPFRLLCDWDVIKYEVKSEDEVEPDDVASADAVVFFRNIRPATSRLLDLARSKNIKTIYAIDDHFLAIPLNTKLGRRYDNPDFRETFTRFIRDADIVKVDATFFGHHLATHYNPKKIVNFPASVDFEYLEKLEKPQRNSEQIVIGYEGVEKKGAFQPLIPAIKKILDGYGDRVRFEFMGYMPKELRGYRSVSFIEGVADYREFLKRFYGLGWDIGLAPLEDNLFQHCKTNNKYREYAACQVAGIYSISPVYREWVKHGETGIFVQQKKSDWFKAIRQMIESSKLRETIREEALRSSKQYFSVEACANHWREHVFQA